MTSHTTTMFDTAWRLNAQTITSRNASQPATASSSLTPLHQRVFAAILAGTLSLSLVELLADHGHQIRAELQAQHDHQLFVADSKSPN